MNKKIGIIAGSLRKESFSKKIAAEVVNMAPAGFDFEIISIADLPLYNQDFDDEGNVPQAYTVFRDKMATIEGVIFITPEYNRSVPGVLKNAIDVGSRPYGKSIWSRKPAAIFSNSPSNLSAFGANHHLRQSLVFLDMPIMQQPEVYIAKVSDCFDENGNLSESKTRDFLQVAVIAYLELFTKVIGK
ncbi:NAD(P)H-dependent oxidoreductase [Pedobacter sp. MC2016-14]|uniref:NADPH-dependent FMN reductase n=1 Tax=Pedobacter sp. MC2016-14 TaxID=2897327 RepID=UPI001E54178E|nr:NAD(P)H-dependent oxidoreductase [Pedobacter sp. MC2016-14]MCD0489146.1 NAD(P)H-dependent oxidoreductase [Pedobacter sp. MC2016-14]